jgi:excisionase family DNA binding protein
MPLEQHYLVNQVAEKLQIDRDRVCRLIASQQLRAVKVGREYRIPESALEDLVVGLSTVKHSRR